MTTPHPHGETIALDPIPAADNPIVRNARVLADILFIDPPPAYMARATEYLAGIQGRDEDGLVEWAQRQHLAEIDGWESNGIAWREFRGFIEGVQFKVTVEVTA